jgi:hypothetical protein
MHDARAQSFGKHTKRPMVVGMAAAAWDGQQRLILIRAVWKDAEESVKFLK